jgi:hypothetical protein
MVFFIIQVNHIVNTNIVPLFLNLVWMQTIIMSFRNLASKFATLLRIGATAAPLLTTNKFLGP